MSMIQKQCSFIDTGFDTYQCQNCGVVVTSYEGPPIMMCSFSDTDIKELQELDFAASISTIQNRYNICKSCDFYSNHSCSKCGCRVVSFMEFKNKLVWKDQECPIGKWGKDI